MLLWGKWVSVVGSFLKIFWNGIYLKRCLKSNLKELKNKRKNLFIILPLTFKLLILIWNFILYFKIFLSSISSSWRSIPTSVNVWNINVKVVCFYFLIFNLFIYLSWLIDEIGRKKFKREKERIIQTPQIIDKFEKRLRKEKLFEKKWKKEKRK